MTICFKSDFRGESILLSIYLGVFIWGYISPQGLRCSVCNKLRHYSRNAKALHGLINLKFLGPLIANSDSWILLMRLHVTHWPHNFSSWESVVHPLKHMAVALVRKVPSSILILWRTRYLLHMPTTGWERFLSFRFRPMQHTSSWTSERQICELMSATYTHAHSSAVQAALCLWKIFV